MWNHMLFLIVFDDIQKRKAENSKVLSLINKEKSIEKVAIGYTLIPLLFPIQKFASTIVSTA